MPTGAGFHDGRRWHDLKKQWPNFTVTFSTSFFIILCIPYIKQSFVNGRLCKIACRVSIAVKQSRITPTRFARLNVYSKIINRHRLGRAFQTRPSALFWGEYGCKLGSTQVVFRHIRGFFVGALAVFLYMGQGLVNTLEPGWYPCFCVGMKEHGVRWSDKTRVWSSKRRQTHHQVDDVNERPDQNGNIQSPRRRCRRNSFRAWSYAPSCRRR